MTQYPHIEKNYLSQRCIQKLLLPRKVSPEKNNQVLKKLSLVQ